jgi:hypothetical protein
MKKLKDNPPTLCKVLHQIKALAEKAIDKKAKKRQAICRKREGLREGERVANLFSLLYSKIIKICFTIRFKEEPKND